MQENQTSFQTEHLRSTLASGMLNHITNLWALRADCATHGYPQVDEALAEAQTALYKAKHYLYVEPEATTPQLIDEPMGAPVNHVPAEVVAQQEIRDILGKAFGEDAVAPLLTAIKERF